MSIADGSRGACLASANLPIYGGRDMKIYVFGRRPEDAEVVALVHKKPGASDEAVVRMHSTCLTGDVFGSAKCDCGGQLRIAINAISNADHGIVLYFMHHEGRGIGLLNKVRAYALQDQGLDTVEANRALGFEPDARDFGIAADALRELGVTRVRLLTNNPDKLAALERGGIQVIERLTADAPMTEHNRDYLDTKRRFFGHMPARDPITEYLTPDAFAELFDTQIADSARAQSGVWVVAIQVESFRQVRGSLGIDAANEMLHAVTRRLKQGVRSDEILTRVAEDRILLVLEGVSIHVAGKVTDRVRELVSGMAFEWGDRKHRIATRVGVLQLRPGEDLSTLLADTERLLAEDPVLHHADPPVAPEARTVRSTDRPADP
jgi:GTP cyclohydrolase II